MIHCFRRERICGDLMKRFVERFHRGQSTLLPECLDDWIDENNPVRVVDAFVEAFNLAELGFAGGAGGYHAPILLKLYIYGHSQSGREAGRQKLDRRVRPAVSEAKQHPHR